MGLSKKNIRIALSTGEPAGIGPDLAVLIAQHNYPFELVTIADPDLLQERADILGLKINILPFEPERESQPSLKGEITLKSVPLSEQVECGKLSLSNSSYVMEVLDQAISLCQTQICSAMVTGPIQKSILCDAGFNIKGHTEYLAEKTNTEKVVMMLASDELRVALVTTHLPLIEVSAAINTDSLKQTIQILHHDLQYRFGILKPKIFVCGLNPHAGEHGHLGKEEEEVITPCLNLLRDEGLDLVGPLPADTIFDKKNLEQADTILAMYHDQGLPVLKYQSFGSAVNITLGLPIIRTSVDHGTALDLAGTGNIDSASLSAALSMAFQLAQQKASADNHE